MQKRYLTDGWLYGSLLPISVDSQLIVKVPVGAVNEE